MSSHTPLLTSASAAQVTIKLEQPPQTPATTQKAVTTTHLDDADVRATTAMAIVELLATGGAASSSTHTTAAAQAPAHSAGVSPLWVDSRLHCKNSTSSSSTSNSSTCGAVTTPLAPFPGLPSLLPMKRPLWCTSGTSAGDSLESTTHVHIQPLPSIAQLSKLAVSTVERLSPTAIDGVATANVGSLTAASDSLMLTPVLAPAPAPAPVKATAGAPTSVNHSRKRQKDELDRLRVQVQELQRELEHVRARLPKRPTLGFTLNSGVTGAPGSPELFASLLPSSVAVWERIATHQKEQKNRSEMENMKLKAMVAEQVKISKALEKLVNKRCKNSSLESKFAAKRLRVCDSDEQRIFDALTHDIDARYPQSSATLEALGMRAATRESQAVQMILDPVHGPTMELRDATIFPFDVAAISAAVWRSMEAEALGCSESMGLIETLLVHSTDDTICAKTTVPIRQTRAPEAELSIRVVIKRFVEHQRVVILWESISDCLGKLPSPCALLAGIASPLPRNVEMRDRGWCVIETLPSAPGRHSSIIQICSHVTPRIGSSCAGESGSHLTLQHMQRLVDSLAPYYRYIWENRQQVMENILMENVVGVPRTGASAWSPLADATVHSAAAAAAL